MIDALILAGEDFERKGLGVSVKALVEIHGKPMVYYVIDALKKSGIIGKIVMVGPSKILYPLFHDQIDCIIDGKQSMLDNVFEGMQHLGVERKVLISTSDIPMLTSECINDFVVQAEQVNADLCYPIVDKAVNDLRFSGIERTYTKMKEGTFTGGNLFYVNPLIVNKCCSKAQQLINHRKNVLKMAQILGWKTLFLLFTKKLSIQYAEERFSRIFDIKAKAIISTFPELANDVDKISDLNFVKEYLSIGHNLEEY
ncbi:MAG: NTP transferase domain-containing protein [Clostridia bacterium]